MTGARPCQRGTGQTQRPGSGPASTAGALARRERRCASAYASAPPPAIQDHARTSDLLLMATAQQQVAGEQPATNEHGCSEAAKEPLTDLSDDLARRFCGIADDVDRLAARMLEGVGQV